MGTITKGRPFGLALPIPDSALRAYNMNPPSLLLGVPLKGYLSLRLFGVPEVHPPIKGGWNVEEGFDVSTSGPMSTPVIDFIPEFVCLDLREDGGPFLILVLLSDPLSLSITSFGLRVDPQTAPRSSVHGKWGGRTSFRCELGSRRTTNCLRFFILLMKWRSYMGEG